LLTVLRRISSPVTAVIAAAPMSARTSALDRMSRTMRS